MGIPSLNSAILYIVSLYFHCVMSSVAETSLSKTSRKYEILTKKHLEVRRLMNQKVSRAR